MATDLLRDRKRLVAFLSGGAVPQRDGLSENPTTPVLTSRPEATRYEKLDGQRQERVYEALSCFQVRDGDPARICVEAEKQGVVCVKATEWSFRVDKVSAHNGY